MARTIIDIRKDGIRVVPDPSQTLVHHYDPELLARLGALKPASPEDPIYKAGVAAGLGSFFDMLVARGLTREEVQELLCDVPAYQNLKAA
jgi:hypothetical protein